MKLIEKTTGVCGRRQCIPWGSKVPVALVLRLDGSTKWQEWIGCLSQQQQNHYGWLGPVTGMRVQVSLWVLPERLHEVG